MPFSKLGLADQLVQGILATGYTAPTTIQSQAIPIAISGRDIIGIAQTGTGKTAAFVLPMLNHFLKHAHHKGRHVRGLVLTPTRELALQVEEFITGYGQFTNMLSMAIFGGVSMENQIKKLHRGLDIVVATPGRLIDHINRRTIDLSKVEILVLDEADRMFDMGFIQDVRRIIARVPTKRQTLLFSATMSKEVKDLVASIQTNPELIEIGEQRKPVETVKQFFYSCAQESKMDLLFYILRNQELDSVLVFSRTKHGADKITRKLERAGIKAVAIHSNRTQAQRQRALAGFKQGHFKVMVATDIAARGIDVEGISHVINYDTPTFAEDYIHRIGRTGRAAMTGDAITFVSNQEHKYFKSIERYTGKHYELKRYEGFDYSKKPPAADKQNEPKSLHEHRDSGHKREEDRQDRHVSHSSEHVHHGKHHSDSLGKSKHEHQSADSFKKQNRFKRHKGSSGKPHRDQRHSGSFSNSNREFTVPDHRGNNRSSSHKVHKPELTKKPSFQQSKPKEQSSDWRTLVASMEENRGGLKKKLKRLFLRENL
jgi:ATP-dependent RNA helicase RhlE